MIFIDNGPTDSPIIELAKKAFEDQARVILTIQHDGKLVNIPAYMTEIRVPNKPPFYCRITIESAAEPIMLFEEQEEDD